MKTAGFFAGQPAGLQLLALLLFILGGSILSSLLGMGLFFLFYGTNAQIGDFPDMLRLLQFLTASGTFILPALLIAWFYSDSPKEFLSLDKRVNIQSVALIFINILLITPSITLLSWINEQLSFPEWAAPLETWMKEHEDLAQDFTYKLINGDGICPYLSNIIVIALTAAVSEELLFRGALQRIIGRWTENPHTVIWITAILFSAFHLQFYGFIPRMLLGAYFGYLLLWSKNIWLPICAHFFNNALTVTFMSSGTFRESDFVTGNLENEHLLPYAIFAIITGFLFLLTNRTLKKVSK